MTENTQQLAEQIAKILENNSKGNDLDFLKNEIGKINNRLVNIENTLVSQNSNSTPHLALRTPHSNNHPSQKKFIEILADEIIENIEKEKACPYEPTGKPCDNCSMCSAFGF